eukprot:scaffold289730_cov36-Tisochrysis_lutea.AAC.2
MRPVRPQPAASKAATTTDRPASAARANSCVVLSKRHNRQTPQSPDPFTPIVCGTLWLLALMRPTTHHASR